MDKSATLACVLLIFVLFSVTTGQDESRLIGSIDFYGYAGLNLDRVRHALPVHVGDKYPGPLAIVEEVNKAIVSVVGRAPTDVAPVCCDSDGNYTIYVGLPGASIKPTQRNRPPSGKTKFPPEIVELYEATMDASTAAVLKGNAREDSSKGYALSTSDQSLRNKQLTVRAYAVAHEKLIRDVLEYSSDPKQRIVAAYLLGYARRSSRQISYLVQSTHDVDDTVRNNATRALGVLAESSQKVAAQIPAAGFMEMLSSGSWTDRNKASWVLTSLTRSRNPKMLAQLRSEALTPLIEMARWRNAGHAYNARILLARIAGVEEERARQLANAKDGEEVIRELGFEP